MSKRATIFFINCFIFVTFGLIVFVIVSLFADIADNKYPTYYLSKLHNTTANNISIHIDLDEIDEWKGTSTLRISAHDSCTQNCPWDDKITLVAIKDKTDTSGSIPPSASISFPASERDITQQVQLPIYGDPVLYPFDTYKMGIAVLIQREYQDGRIEEIHVANDATQVEITFQARTPRLIMQKPQIIEKYTANIYGDLVEHYEDAAQLSFTRPLYMKILALLLVVFITTASAYAVFLGPLDDLLINSGAIVFGVWGIREILLGNNQQGITVADLTLSLIVLFLLIAITIRGFSRIGSKNHIAIFNILNRGKKTQD